MRKWQHADVKAGGGWLVFNQEVVFDRTEETSGCS